MHVVVDGIGSRNGVTIIMSMMLIHHYVGVRWGLDSESSELLTILAESLTLQIDQTQRVHVPIQFVTRFVAISDVILLVTLGRIGCKDESARILDLAYEMRQLRRSCQAAPVSVDVLDRIGLDHAQVLVLFLDTHLRTLPLNDHVARLHNDWFLAFVGFAKDHAAFDLRVREPTFDDHRLRFRRQRCETFDDYFSRRWW